MGRMSTFTQDAANAICDRLADGEPLRQICRDSEMPAWRTVYDWCEAHSDFAARFAQARDVGADAIAEQCLEIADDSKSDYVEARGFDSEHVQRSKLRVETRLKLLAKWNPKKYGDRLDIEHSGSVVVKTDPGDEAV